MSNLVPRVLLLGDIEMLLAFERQRLEETVGDDMEREMQSWSARWRPEALEHYLKLGWSYGVFEAERLRGYILAQPYLFHRGLTQTLWVEHVAADAKEVTDLLVDTVYRWARDKHFQVVLLDDGSREIKSSRFN
jgi:hypothetical protein